MQLYIFSYLFGNKLNLKMSFFIISPPNSILQSFFLSHLDRKGSYDKMCLTEMKGTKSQPENSLGNVKAAKLSDNSKVWN